MAAEGLQLGSADVRIDFMELIAASGDATPLERVFVSFNMYENLFRDQVTADIMINDSINLPYKLPILGEEYLNFEISCKSVKGEGPSLAPGNMYVTSITDRHQTKDRQQLYIIHLTSEQDMINSNTTVSQAFRGKKISEIVQTILEDYCFTDNDFVIEETNGVENIVIPNWKPFKAINWLAKRALNTNDVPNYLFYESNGSTFFKSIDKLMQQEIKQEFVFGPVVDKNDVLYELTQGKTHITDLKIIHQFDTIRNTLNGYYASKLITHDIVTKKIEQRTWGLNQTYDESISHTDDWMPISATEPDYGSYMNDRHSFAPQELGFNAGSNVQSYFDSKVMFYPKHNNMYAENSVYSGTDVYDNRVEDWKLQRNALILGLDQVKLSIVFPGLSYLRVGALINIVVPSTEKVREEKPGMVKNPDDLIDKFLSGNYLIVALKHRVAWAEGLLRYTMHAECVKDALHAVPTYRL
tara:strand:+ start:657 stop:2063 length:1407 start_codon:yes stop_codon:yes gene_type:complete